MITSNLALSELATLLSFVLLMAKLAKTAVRLRAWKPSLVPPFEFQRAQDLPALASCKTLGIPRPTVPRAVRRVRYATADADTPAIYICSREQEVAGCAAIIAQLCPRSPCLFKPAERRAARNTQSGHARAAAGAAE